MKNKQGLTIAALIIAIVGLSIGFAAFSNTLQISSSASVNPDASALKVVFAKDYFTEQKTTLNQLDTTAVVPTTAGTGVTATNGVINNDGQDGPTLTGLSAAFTQPGQSVTYDLYVVNAGQLKAYLTDLVFGTTGSPAQAVSCTVATKDSNNQDIPLEQQATDSLVQAACAGISISVKIGNLSAMTTTSSLNNLELDVRDHETVQIVITYAQGSAYVDGPMNVAFGDITLSASSVGTQVAQSGGEEEEGSCQVANVKSFSSCTLSQDNGTAGLSKGDKVTCGTESFYVIEDPSNGTTKMLAEWNLNVSETGDIKGLAGVPYSYTYCESTVGYQDSHVRGYLNTSDESLLPNLYTLNVEYSGQQINMPWPYGTVKFDKITTEIHGYWTTGDDRHLNTSVYTACSGQSYCSAYPNDEYPSYVYDGNTTFKGFVDAYVGYLNSALSTNATGRLITYEELNALGCSGSNYTCSNSPATAPSWVYQTSYWTGSAGGSGRVWYVKTNGAMNDAEFERSYDGSSGGYGVRPVIEISSLAIQTS